jgi:hypothetical protein
MTESSLERIIFFEKKNGLQAKPNRPFATSLPVFIPQIQTTFDRSFPPSMVLSIK